MQWCDRGREGCGLEAIFDVSSKRASPASTSTEMASGPSQHGTEVVLPIRRELHIEAFISACLYIVTKGNDC